MLNQKLCNAVIHIFESEMGIRYNFCHIGVVFSLPFESFLLPHAFFYLLLSNQYLPEVFFHLKDIIGQLIESIRVALNLFGCFTLNNCCYFLIIIFGVLNIRIDKFVILVNRPFRETLIFKSFNSPLQLYPILLCSYIELPFRLFQLASVTIKVIKWYCNLLLRDYAVTSSLYKVTAFLQEPLDLLVHFLVVHFLDVIIVVFLIQQIERIKLGLTFATHLLLQL
jgi:hypothetical protein